jgi:hypothetical protein
MVGQPQNNNHPRDCRFSPRISRLLFGIYLRQVIKYALLIVRNRSVIRLAACPLILQ